MNLMRTKTVEQSVADADQPENRLRRELGPLSLRSPTPASVS